MLPAESFTSLFLVISFLSLLQWPRPPVRCWRAMLRVSTLEWGALYTVELGLVSLSSEKGSGTQTCKEDGCWLAGGGVTRWYRESGSASVTGITRINCQCKGEEAFGEWYSQEQKNRQEGSPQAVKGRSVILSSSSTFLSPSSALYWQTEPSRISWQNRCGLQSPRPNISRLTTDGWA